MPFLAALRSTFDCKALTLAARPLTKLFRRRPIPLSWNWFEVRLTKAHSSPSHPNRPSLIAKRATGIPVLTAGLILRGLSMSWIGGSTDQSSQTPQSPSIHLAGLRGNSYGGSQDTALWEINPATSVTGM